MYGVCLLMAAWLSVLSVQNNLGADYVIYKNIYNELQFWQFSSCVGVELGWCLPAMLLSKFEISYEYVAFGFSLLIYSLATIFLTRIMSLYQLRMWYLVLALMAFGFFVVRPEMASHLNRQYIAAMFLILSVTESALWKSWCWFVAVIMFHISVVFMLPALFIVRYGGFTRRRVFLLFVMFILCFTFFASSGYDAFISWALEVNIKPRLLYNIFYKLKYVVAAEDGLPYWKALFVVLGVVPLFYFIDKKIVQLVVGFYVYYLAFMVFVYFVSPIYYVGFFHYGKILLFCGLTITLSEVATGNYPKIFNEMIKRRI